MPGEKSSRRLARGTEVRLSCSASMVRPNGYSCVTTRRRNFWLWNGLGHGLGLLTAHSFCLGMLGLDLGVSAAFGLPLRRPPAVDLSLAFRFLAESLVPTARLVLTSALFVQAGPRARAAGSGLGTSLSFNVVRAHGRSVSQGKARGGCVSILPGRHQNEDRNPWTRTVKACAGTLGHVRRTCQRCRRSS